MKTFLAVQLALAPFAAFWLLPRAHGPPITERDPAGVAHTYHVAGVRIDIVIFVIVLVVSMLSRGAKADKGAGRPQSQGLTP